MSNANYGKIAQYVVTDFIRNNNRQLNIIMLLLFIYFYGGKKNETTRLRSSVSVKIKRMC